MHHTEPVHIVLNPTAGGGTGARAQREIERDLARLGVPFEIHLTRGRGHAMAMAREFADRGVAVVAAAGGDGTIHEVVNGLMESGRGSTTLALIPIGTGNDFVKVVDGTRTMPEAIQTIAEGTPRRFDVGRVRWDGSSEFFINGMGTGIDVEVVRQLHRLPHMPGALKYLLALLRALVSFRPVRLHASINGDAIDTRAMILAVGNGTCQGGGFYLAPEARPDDGVFDVTLVREVRLREVFTLVPRILRGTQRGHEAVLMRTVRSLHVKSGEQKPLNFHVDGELRESTSHAFDVEVVPGALAVLARDAQRQGDR